LALINARRFAAPAVQRVPDHRSAEEWLQPLSVPPMRLPRPPARIRPDVIPLDHPPTHPPMYDISIFRSARSAYCGVAALF
jgi:hypothetical protein